MARAPQRSEKVHAHHVFVPTEVSHLVEERVAGDSSVVDEDVDASEARERGVDQRLAVGFDTDVAADSDRFGACSDALSDDALHNLDPPRGQHELRLLRRQLSRKLSTYAVGGAGDDNDVVLEAHRRARSRLHMLIVSTQFATHPERDR